MRRLLAVAAVVAAAGFGSPAYAGACDEVDLGPSRAGWCTGQCTTVWLDLVERIQDDGLAVIGCPKGEDGKVCYVNGRQYDCVL